MNNISPVWVYKTVNNELESILTTEDVAVDMYKDDWCDSPAKCDKIKDVSLKNEVNSLTDDSVISSNINLLDMITECDDIEILKTAAIDLGIKVHHKAGIKKIRADILLKLELSLSESL